MRATIDGWKYAFANPDEIARLITDKANQTEFKTTFEHQKAMLQAMEGLLTFRVGPDGIGDLSRKYFDFVYMVLEHSKQIDKPFTYDDFFRKVRWRTPGKISRKPARRRARLGSGMPPSQ